MKYFIILLSIVIFTSCDWAKQKTKNTINKTGEVVAKSGAEFADGVSKGVEKTFENKITFSTELSATGLKSGKTLINSTDSSTNNILTTYLIFDNDIEKNITVKIFDTNQKEYGRVSQIIKGKKGEAKYIDFVFDRRTNIDGKGMITFE